MFDIEKLNSLFGTHKQALHLPFVRKDHKIRKKQRETEPLHDSLDSLEQWFSQRDKSFNEYLVYFSLIQQGKKLKL